jgi:hypothetical protein
VSIQLLLSPQFIIMRFSLRDLLDSAADAIGGAGGDNNNTSNGNGREKNNGADSDADSTSAAGGLLSVSIWAFICLISSNFVIASLEPSRWGTGTWRSSHHNDECCSSSRHSVGSLEQHI